MGNGVSGCCAVTTAGDISKRYDVVPVHDNLGHSFCYVGPVLNGSRSSFQQEPSLRLDSIPGATTTTFSISGASVSANTSTALSAGSPSTDASLLASGFESSSRFASLPLKPVPRSPSKKPGHESGVFERRFLSGPNESGLVSGPVGKNKKKKEKPKKIKSFTKPKPNKKFLTFKTIVTNIISSCSKKSVVEPIYGSYSSHESLDSYETNTTLRSQESRRTTKEQEEEEEEEMTESVLEEEPKIQWAQGKAGEDRVHVILSEDNGWLFVGIYDGFSGPDPPDYLLNNLYTAVLKELKGLLWNDKLEVQDLESYIENGEPQIKKHSTVDQVSVSGHVMKEVYVACDSRNMKEDYVACESRNMKEDSDACDSSNVTEDVTKLQWRCEWEHNSRNKNSTHQNRKGTDLDMVNHKDVLRALQQALKKTEEAFDLTVDENPELALMGSCVLVTLMKGEDVYVMSVGDSRAVLARRPDLRQRKKMQNELERIKEESPLETFLVRDKGLNLLVPVQLNMEHSTNNKEEVRRIKMEHPDDPLAIEKDRVKGYLKVTRAFGAGFLKQPKWNEALLEMFRINYFGTSPYITCSPSLHHHRLTSRDKFLILSSDGLYEYFSNEEAIFEVDSFISAFPEGDPAQHLIQEVLLRAAKKYGMDFHELLEIPQGDRRKYHDDVSVIVISLEGRIWKSSM
ncbi:PREDICTED: probable protein phosphatase 2C 36 [Brassica oleracea var. oleracea]|uniref:PPM-type phosphatase domain-containing protein n=1 Tax=Brassica oleracea var. oleracea TaxID=109376 RepID=A0A0D3BAD6_BRAOL|nr:PREDICTED: probable protein phosphatase 2C 36 [Brassica oleracea var. oleracea]